MIVKPLNGFVMIEELPKTHNRGRIIVMNPHKETAIGRVVAQGPGWVKTDGSLLKPKCAVDDFVCYKHGAGASINIEGTRYRFVPCQEILALVEDVESDS